MNDMKHKHHILPKHRGGDDSPANLVEVSVEEHAELHLAAYLSYGHWQDWVAYHALSGQISMSEASQEAIRRGQVASRQALTPEGKKKQFEAAHTPEANAKRSATMTGRKRGPYKLKKVNSGWFKKGWSKK